MPVFQYRVRDRSGKALVGTIDAPTPQVAGDRLYHLGYLPVQIERKESSPSSNLAGLWRSFQKVDLEELIFFSQQLSILYKAGLPLLSGLKALTEQTANKRLKTILTAVGPQIEGGSALFEALSGYPDVFSPVYIHMIRAGEVAGRLGESLDRFVTLADRELRTRRRVKEATRYPKIVILSLVIAFAVLIAFVIPRFAEVFARFHTPLPLPTQMMIGLNTIVQKCWYLILLTLLGAAGLLRRYLRTSQGKYFWDRLKMRIPGLGPLFLKMALSRFAYIFVLLNQSGIPILQTLEITSSTIDNRVLSQSIEAIGQRVKEGKSLTEAMKESGRFTLLVLQMVAVGESSGSLDQMLMRVTEYYDLEVESAIKKLSAYIEPALTLVMGITVLFLALAVFLPWWNLASLFR